MTFNDTFMSFILKQAKEWGSDINVYSLILGAPIIITLTLLMMIMAVVIDTFLSIKRYLEV